MVAVEDDPPVSLGVLKRRCCGRDVRAVDNVRRLRTDIAPTVASYRSDTTEAANSKCPAADKRSVAARASAPTTLVGVQEDHVRYVVQHDRGCGQLLRSRPSVRDAPLVTCSRVDGVVAGAPRCATTDSRRSWPRERSRHGECVAVTAPTAASRHGCAA